MNAVKNFCIIDSLEITNTDNSFENAGDRSVYRWVVVVLDRMYVNIVHRDERATANLCSVLKNVLKSNFQNR